VSNATAQQTTPAKAPIEKPAAVPPPEHKSLAQRLDLTPKQVVLFGALILVVNIPIIHRFLLRPHPAITKSVPFEDDFNRAEIGPDYHWIGAQPRIRDGTLEVPGAKNNPVWLNLSLPRNARVEVDARCESVDGDIKIEMYGNGWDHGSGYMLYFGGWTNTISVIAKLAEDAPEMGWLQSRERRGEDHIGPSTAFRVERREPKVEKGRTYHYRIDRVGGVLRWYIDNSLFLELDDPYPLYGSWNDRLGLSTFDSNVYFDNLKVTSLEGVSLESAPPSSSIPASVAPPAPKPKPAPFADSFDRSELGPDWHATGPEAVRMEDGALGIRVGHNRPVWLTKSIPDDATIEFDCWSDGSDGDIKVEAWGDGQSFYSGPLTGAYTATGYAFVFGGWHNSLSAIARLYEHPPAKERNDVKVIPGQHYHWQIVRNGNRLTWSIDNQVFLELDDPSPLRGPGHDHFAFSDWESSVHFDNLKITPL
jgi:hypothetical protein